MDSVLKESVQIDESLKAELRMIIMDVLDGEPCMIGVKIESGIVKLGDIVSFTSTKGQKINAQIGLIIKHGKYPKQAVA